jgi:uncharacterized protein YndB with AHSA1/START domain
MTVESMIDKSTLTTTFVATFAASPDRLWQVWDDARQLERWWGPPTWPATVAQHEFRVGGESRYYMTGPEGDKAHGWMRWEQLDEPSTIRFVDGFGDKDGNPDPAMPRTHSVVTFAATDGGTTMTIAGTFESIEDLEKVITMGFEEGMSLAMKQIEDILSSTVSS